MLMSGPSVLLSLWGGGGDVGEGKTVDVIVRVAGKGKRQHWRGKKGNRKKGGVNEARGNIVEEEETNNGEGRTSEKDQLGVCAEKRTGSGCPHARVAAGGRFGNERELCGNMDGDVECLSMLGFVSGEEVGRSRKRRRKEAKTEEEVENKAKAEEQSWRENRREAKKRSAIQPMVRVTVREDGDSSPAVCAGCWYYHLRMLVQPRFKMSPLLSSHLPK